MAEMREKESAETSARTVTIYALHDPTDISQRVYVGKTLDPIRRLKHHLQRRRDRTPCRHWIESLRARGVRPEMVTLEVVPPGGDWQEAERFWIESMRVMGVLNLNVCDGGKGTAGWRMSEETRAHLRSLNTGKKLSEETKRKQSLAATGRRATPETKRKLSAIFGKILPALGAAANRRRREVGKKRPPLGITHQEHIRRLQAGAAAARTDGRAGRTSRRAKSRRDSGTGFKGVAFRCGRYFARIKINGVDERIGCFTTAEAAAWAYDERARQIGGPDAALNYPAPGERSARAGVAPQAWSAPDGVGVVRRSKAGHRGVQKSGTRFAAYYNRKKLGSFATLEAAVEAYEEARRKARGARLKG